MTNEQALKIRKGSKIYYDGEIYNFATIKKNNNEIFVGIYLNMPANKVTFLNPANVKFAYNCPSCIGCGCAMCGGTSYITELKYNKKEDIISSYKIDNDLFYLFAWCDISGYDYWVIQQEQENYVSIDVCLKKLPNEYTEKELITIRDAIIKADEYFISELL